MTPYEELLARLLPARRFGVVLGLERMFAIFERLGHPERKLGRVVHVGGTNGKGSTVAMIARLLELGLATDERPARIAIYTSPHLSTLRERIRFSRDQLISEAAIVAAADQVTAAGGDELTFFEQLTAIACVAIADRGVDATVLEVGLGGRLDATNAIPAEIAVVTGVAMDHAAILGETLEKIALEKAGIFKPGQQVVIGASGEPEAVPVLVNAAQRVGARAVIVDDARLAEVQSLTHLGVYKVNAAAAIAAVETLLGHRQVYLRDDLILPPGRFEIIERDDLDVILDGAHNPHAAIALAAELRARGIRPVLIVAASSDKDVAGIVAALAPIARGVIATRYQQDRAMAPDELAARFRAQLISPTSQTGPSHAPPAHVTSPTSQTGTACESTARLNSPTSIPVETAPSLAAALARVRDPAGPFHRDPTGSVIHPRPEVVITGSLFLVGEARTRLLDAPTDPFVVTDPPAR